VEVDAVSNVRLALWTATLNPQSPRYAEWKAALQSDTIPLVGPGEMRGELGTETTNVYLVDVSSLTTNQKNRLAEHLAAKFKTKPAEVLREMETSGLPIRTADVIVAYSICEVFYEA
jgi:hypothetical protein